MRRPPLRRQRLAFGVAGRLLGLVLVLGAGRVPSARSAGSFDEAPVDYLRDVKPILAEHCVACHGEERPRARLRLDTAEAALAGGVSGPVVVPGEPEESELYLAVIGEGATDPMPLNRPALAESEIATLKAWIAAGAPGPETDERPSRAESTHWAFQPPVRPEVPEVADSSWPRNPIDRFILAPLERDGLEPAPEADRATLIRRLSLDLIGLPPTPEQVSAFLRDTRPDAYERLVDRLLASPHYGERWGRIWLDAARYADSNGYSIDAPRSIWLYRDWVIDAFNRDLPFDAFTIDQLAGDLKPDATLAQKIATGFHRNTPINQEGGIDVEQFRIESIINRVETTGTVWMGLTIACAQCHDHKYDPISQQDYYEFFAFFNTSDEPTLPVATPEVVALQEEIDGRILELLKRFETDAGLLEAQRVWEEGLDMAGRQKQSQAVREAFDTLFDERTAEVNRPAFRAFLEQTEDPRAAEAQAALKALQDERPKIPTTFVMKEQRDPRTTFFLEGGDFTRPGDPVEPDVPERLPPLETATGARPNRLDLAHWLVDSEHPLTARVAVNRLWQHHFGLGIVETDNDFGTQGAPPSHPELLDWLAVEFVERGWSLKAMHRLIVTSAAYRQSSTATPEQLEADPRNRRFARQGRFRLEAELIRDTALRASGLLTPKIGGPSVFPPQPDGVMTLGQMRREWVADTGPDRYRRGLYTFFWRATPHPLLVGFDAPDATQACTRRNRSNTPLQALMLLNDQVFMECAEALAERVVTENPTADDRARLERAFRLCVARPPDEFERDRLLRLLDDRRAAAEAADRDSAEAERSAWLTVARVLLNLDETMTRE